MKSRLVYFAVILICLLETGRLWLISPNLMAAHFDAPGNPDRFVAKAEFFQFELQTVLIVVLVSIPPQLLFLVLPANLINLPNREYWLAAGRRKETMDRLSGFGAAMFAVILLAVHGGFELSVSANLHEPIRFNATAMLFIMAAAFLLIVALLVNLIISFQRPAESTL